MDRVHERARQHGIETEYYDGLGRHRVAAPEVLARLLEIFGGSDAPVTRMLPRLAVAREGRPSQVRLAVPDGIPIQWTIASDETIATGEACSSMIPVPDNLPVGSFRLRATLQMEGQGTCSEDATLLVAPARAYQGSQAGERLWAIAAQLYGVRSRRNWGHGDFTDLAGLVDLAADLGAAGVGINPLHALFDDEAAASPYFPSSRFFLNPLYIDVEATAEFPAGAAAALAADIEMLRAAELVDYVGGARLKMQALALAYAAFVRSASEPRKRAFEDFRRARGPKLAAFACFEVLRRRFAGPWWHWPSEWRRPDGPALARLRAAEGEALGFHEYVQWLADEQLGRCRDRARQRGLPIGLYLDVAVGVRADGFDAWHDQTFILHALEIGAPADALNTHGQHWGLAGINPVALVERGCEPFRRVLRASMRYAGAIRLDHVLGLKRLYLIPSGVAPDQGTYVHLPFEALLAVAAQESVANRCIFIGEDLGTVPDGFRETLADWGIWSYQVMMFERAADGGFIAPHDYRETALVTFATHDLATFAGWREGHDLGVKRELGIDPGESDHDRAVARDRLLSALAARGLHTLEFASIARFLAETPCRLLVVSLEDVLGLVEQVNVPGTTDEHPNWRRRMPVLLEHLKDLPEFRSVAGIMAAAGRSPPR